MKLIRNTLFAAYLDYQVSMRMNPVLTVLLTASTVVFTYEVLKIFGI